MVICKMATPMTQCVEGSVCATVAFPSFLSYNQSIPVDMGIFDGVNIGD